MPLRLAHVSDLHLSPADQRRLEPASALLDPLGTLRPDAVVITGDLTDDGWDSDDELAFGKQWCESNLTRPVMAVPGNHDVGNFTGSGRGEVRPERVNAWESLALSSNLTHERWRLLGINSMLFGTQWPQESRQLESLQSELDKAKQSSRFVALFLHSPLFVESPEESEIPRSAYWLGPRTGRARVLEVIKPFLGRTIRLIGSGHVHQSRIADFRDTRIAWAPPVSGTWVTSDSLPNEPPPDRTGFWLHELHADGRIDTRYVETTSVKKVIEWPPRDHLKSKSAGTSD